MTRIILVTCVLGVLMAGTAEAAPVAGTVADGPAADIAFQWKLNQIDANWSGFSDPIGIAEYEWAVGTTPGATNVQGFTSVGTATSASNAGLTLTDATTYYVTVRATSNAGLSVTATSDGVKTDATPPLGGFGDMVNDGTGADIQTQTSLTRIDANWSGFSDPESGIVDYAWAIGIDEYIANVQAFTSVGTATSATATGLNLTAGKAYYVAIRVTNGAGGDGLYFSDGVIATLPDTTPPIAGRVNDGMGADVDVQASMGAASGNWDGFRDPESGIAKYEAGLGTTPGGTEVISFVNMRLYTHFEFGLPVTAGRVTYYVTVRATNGGGLSTISSSDGFTGADGPGQPNTSPDVIDFGSVPVGQSSSAHQVTVRNNSAITWYVASAASDNPEFAVDLTGLPSSLTPGQEGVVSLTLKPEEEGARAGVLSISFSGGAAPNTIALIGTGVPRPEGCGCASGGGVPAAAALLVVALGLKRRREARATR